jgi:hypothetical protein
MTQYAYCELWTATSSLGGKFGVVRDGYNEIIRKRSTVEETMDGGLDVQVGGIHKVYNLIIRVRHTEPDAGYGTRQDLQDLYELNNPQAAASNLLWYTNHHGTVEQVYMVGDFQGSLLGCEIEGNTAWWDVQVQLRVKPA